MEISPPPAPEAYSISLLKLVAVTATDDFPVALGPIRRALKGIARVRTVALPFRTLTKKEEIIFANELKGAEGLLVRSGYITSTLLDRIPQPRVVAVHGAGVDQVNVSACTARGILVTNAPGENADSVAEFTLGLMLSLARRIPQAAQRVLEMHEWGEARHTGGELRGKTLGIIGLGEVGSRLARMTAALGMKVYAHDPGIPRGEFRKRNARPMRLETLLQASDFVALHAPLLPETHHLIDRRRIALMKKGGFLVNAARGPLVDEKALAAALRSGRLAGAALDVLEGEPPDPKSPIFKAPNVLLTPHMAGSTRDCLEAIARVNAEDIARVLKGRKSRHPVNKPAGKRGISL